MSQGSECAVPEVDMSKELEVLIIIDALSQVGCKGEVSEWIRGSKLSWTNAESHVLW